MLKSFVIYTEYDGVFILKPNHKGSDEHNSIYNTNNSRNGISDYKKPKTTPKIKFHYENVYSTIKNDIYHLLINNKMIEVIGEKTVRVGNKQIENVNPIIFG
jgi:hypothetical protein